MYSLIWLLQKSFRSHTTSCLCLGRIFYWEPRRMLGIPEMFIIQQEPVPHTQHDISHFVLLRNCDLSPIPPDLKEKYLTPSIPHYSTSKMKLAWFTSSYLYSPCFSLYLFFMKTNILAFLDNRLLVIISSGPLFFQN